MGAKAVNEPVTQHQFEFRSEPFILSYLSESFYEIVFGLFFFIHEKTCDSLIGDVNTLRAKSSVCLRNIMHSSIRSFSVPAHPTLGVTVGEG